MDVVKFVKSVNRLCKNQSGCAKCPIWEKGMCMVGFDDDSVECIEETISKVEQWAKDHPVKTRQSELLKIFPDAKIDDDGILAFCPEAFSPKEIDDEHCHKYNKCEECRKDYWLTEVTDNGND